jgi:hypothetical protein
MKSIRSLALALLAAAALPSLVSAADTYRLADTIPVGGAGSWDYVTADAAHHLLFIPRSTHTQVMDTATGGILADIPGQKRNHGVAIAPSSGHGFISDGGDGSVTIFDLKTYAVLGKIKAQDDADGIIYDAATDKVLLVCGDAGVLIPIPANVDPVHGSADPAIDLGGKPEFLAADGKGRVYINLEDKDQVAAVDIAAGKVLAHWPVAPGGSPVGMSMDREHRRLFIGCRKPQKLIVMSADDGAILGDVPIGAGVDATGFDQGCAFASCRDATLTVAGETSPGVFSVVQTVATKPGARTLAIDSATHTLYLPTSEFGAADKKGRPAMKPGSFMILVVKPQP